MLNLTMKGTYQDNTGFNWDYYGDDTDPSNFYIVPRPQFVMDTSGKPSFQITRYTTDGANNGSGYCRFDVELSVPAEIETAIQAQIPVKFPNAKSPYFFVALNYNPGGQAYFDFESGSSPITFSAPVSNFGSNVASFLLPMTKTQLDTLISSLSTSGGSYEIEYHLSVPSRLPAVTAVLTFDSAIAYQYQVTQPTYNSWGDQTSPGSVQQMLNESASSKVNITWGISNPAADLEKAVADWANDTLADLVSAEVQRAIALQGIQSDESFNINEVSSFTNTYSQNMVVNWIIAPKAALPSFPSMGLNIQDFISSVNEQQQQMSVSVFLPFKSDSANHKNVPTPTVAGVTSPALVDHVTVTVKYPTLAQANATYTFAKNESHTFVAAYDESAGAEWSLEYTVTYANTSMAPVKGNIASIDSGAYTLQVEEAGILTVTFNAQQAFATEGTKPTEIDIAFSYVNSTSEGSPITQSLTLNTANQIGTITSYQPLPINNTYNYQLVYVFPGSVRYSAPLVQGENGFSQIIPAANAVHSCNLIIYVPVASASSNPVFDATVQMWYAQAPNLPPGVSSQPTKESPAVFTITANPDAVGNLFGRATFDGFLSSDQPLVYTAAIDAVPEQVNIPETLLNNTTPSVMVTPTQRYFTLEINPTAIDWNTATFQSVQVEVNVAVAQGSASTPPTSPSSQAAFIWNKGEMGTQYMTVGILEGNQVTYTWKANYIFSGQKTQDQSGSGAATDLILNIPATPTS